VPGKERMDFSAPVSIILIFFFTDPGNGPVKGWTTKTRNGRPVDDSTDWSTNSVHHHNSKFQVQV